MVIFCTNCGFKIIDYDIKNGTYHLNMLSNYKTSEQLNIFNFVINFYLNFFYTFT